MKLVILTPEKELLALEGVTLVELPGMMGRFVVLPGHAPLITALVQGVVRYESCNGNDCLQIKGGFAQVKDDLIKVCAD